MPTPPIKELLRAITRAFIDEDKYVFRKIIEEFQVSGKFVGDYYNFIIFEARGTEAPIFYHVLSPFDLISKKAPERGLVFCAGEMMLDVDFSEYTAMRTGAMDTILLQALGHHSLENKRILLFGSGKTAYWSARFLKDCYPELKEIEFLNKQGNHGSFERRLSEFGLDAVGVTQPNWKTYDFIFCHTNCEVPIVPFAARKELKPGVVITSFISSTEHGELEDSYLDTAESNLIIDWPPNLQNAKDVKRAISSGRVAVEKVITLRQLLSAEKTLADPRRITIFRSAGTPIQNLAVLKLLADFPNS